MELERGKTLVIRAQAVGEPDQDGEVRVFFELNGQPRVVKVPDRRHGARGIDRVVLHELGHVVDHALLGDDVMSRLQAGIPAGFAMSSTPPKPASTAAPRRGPTRSPRSGTESSVRNSGMVKPRAVTVASGKVA